MHFQNVGQSEFLLKPKESSSRLDKSTGARTLKFPTNKSPLLHDLDEEAPEPAPTKLHGVYFVRVLPPIVSVQLAELLTQRRKSTFTSPSPSFPKQMQGPQWRPKPAAPAPPLLTLPLLTTVLISLRTLRKPSLKSTIHPKPRLAPTPNPRSKALEPSHASQR
jgi:hypothetical protein